MAVVLGPAPLPMPVGCSASDVRLRLRPTPTRAESQRSRTRMARRKLPYLTSSPGRSYETDSRQLHTGVGGDGNMAPMGSLLVRRANDHGGMMRRLQVLVDGTRVAALKPNEQSIVELDAGPHVGIAKMDWFSSKDSQCRSLPKDSSPSRCPCRSHPPPSCSAKNRE